jgi:hypothetical protein
MWRPFSYINLCKKFLITLLKILTLYKHTIIITHIYVIKSGRENRLYNSTATYLS